MMSTLNKSEPLIMEVSSSIMQEVSTNTSDCSSMKSIPISGTGEQSGSLESAVRSISLNSHFSSFADAIRKLFNYELDFTSNPKRFSSIITCDKNVAVPMDIPLKCSIHHLNVDGECPGFIAGQRGMDLNLARKIPLSSNLESLKVLKRSGKMRTKHYRDTSWTTAALKGGEPDLLPLQEIILKIRVHQPYCAVDDEEKMNLYRPKPQQEFQVLGSQYLTQLRDLITCPNHFVKAGEFSEDPHSHVYVPYAKDIYKSGFFYFGNTFYNDMRNPNNRDYSEVICKWLENNPQATASGKLETAVMEETQFRDLNVRMGYPYVYQHLGDCEHLVIILNVRLINRPDELSSKLYPMHRCPFRQSVRVCSLCGFYVARWITYKNNRMPHDPSFFCNNCMISFNYVNGKKIGNFTAYHYLEREPTQKDLKFTVDVENRSHETKLKVENKLAGLFNPSIPCKKSKKLPSQKTSISVSKKVNTGMKVSALKEEKVSADGRSSSELVTELSPRNEEDEFKSVIAALVESGDSFVHTCKPEKSKIQNVSLDDTSSSEEASDDPAEEEDISVEQEKSTLVTYTKGLPKNPDEDFYVDKYTEIGDEDSDESWSSTSESDSDTIVYDDSTSASSEGEPSPDND